jgi:hypothetical protein
MLQARTSPSDPKPTTPTTSFSAIMASPSITAASDFPFDAIALLSR